MRKDEPATQTVKISEVKSRLSRLVDEVSRNKARVVVEKSGHPVAAIISIDDLQRFARLKRERDERFAVIDRMREAFKDVPPEEIEREAERSVATARASAPACGRGCGPLGVIVAVLDTNVLVSGFPAKLGVTAALIDAWRQGVYKLVISETILDELAETWRHVPRHR